MVRTSAVTRQDCPLAFPVPDMPSMTRDSSGPPSSHSHSRLRSSRLPFPPPAFECESDTFRARARFVRGREQKLASAGAVSTSLAFDWSQPVRAAYDSSVGSVYESLDAADPWMRGLARLWLFLAGAIAGSVLFTIFTTLLMR